LGFPLINDIFFVSSIDPGLLIIFDLAWLPLALSMLLSSRFASQ
jgi:hypothetical protein